jgi:hypothetical protein
MWWDVVGCGVMGCGGMWWDVVGCGGMWSDVVGCGGMWWDVVGCGGMWWDVVGCGVMWWDVVGCGGMLWNVLGVSLSSPLCLQSIPTPMWEYFLGATGKLLFIITPVSGGYSHANVGKLYVQ